MPRIIVEEHVTKEVDNIDKTLVTRKIFTSKASNSNYVKFHITGIDELIKLKLNSSEYALFIALFKYITYENTISFSNKIREDICKELEVSASTVRRSKNKLEEKGVLIPTSYKNEYIVNPMIVTKQSMGKTLDLIEKINKLQKN